MNFTIKELNELIYSLGITALNGRMLDKELNQSLMEKLHAELAYQMSLEVEDDYLYIPKEDEDFKVNHIHIEEDAFTKVLKSNELKKERGWIVQQMLDYVDYCGAVSHTQLENYYKAITKSNSFSHCLINLRIPYKNRKTQRYLAKEGKRGSNAKYVVKVANPSNWVVVND